MWSRGEEFRAWGLRGLGVRVYGLGVKGLGPLFGTISPLLQGTCRFSWFQFRGPALQTRNPAISFWFPGTLGTEMIPTLNSEPLNPKVSRLVMPEDNVR